MRRTLLFVFIAVLAVTRAAAAIEFKPHPTAHITEAQWSAYFDEVRAALGGSAQELGEHKLIVFYDKATGTSYAFTQPAHPAHPAWIARRIANKNVEQIGYFAGREEPFAELFRQYQVTNQRMIEEMEKRVRARENKPQ
jgi:hypothetical protein